MEQNHEYDKISNVITKAEWYVKNGKVKEIAKTDKNWHFSVDTNTGKEFVTVSNQGGVHFKPCTCRSGIFKIGIRQYFCSHQIACMKMVFKE